MCLLGSLIALDFVYAASFGYAADLWDSYMREVPSYISTSEMTFKRIGIGLIFVLPHFLALAWIVPKKPRGCLFALSILSVAWLVFFMTLGSVAQTMG